MNPTDMTRTLREAGLRPTIGRTTVLTLLAEAGGAPQCCEDLYRSAMQAGRALNVSSIAHALADLERVGCIERSVSKEERRPHYRYPPRETTIPCPPVFLEQGNQRSSLDDPAVAQGIARWLAEQGETIGEGDRVVVRIERAGPAPLDKVDP
jgi:hypothetical protein